MKNSPVSLKPSILEKCHVLHRFSCKFQYRKKPNHSDTVFFA